MRILLSTFVALITMQIGFATDLTGKSLLCEDTKLFKHINSRWSSEDNVKEINDNEMHGFINNWHLYQFKDSKTVIKSEYGHIYKVEPNSPMSFISVGYLGGIVTYKKGIYLEDDDNINYLNIILENKTTSQSAESKYKPVDDELKCNNMGIKSGISIRFSETKRGYFSTEVGKRYFSCNKEVIDRENLNLLMVRINKKTGKDEIYDLSPYATCEIVSHIAQPELVEAMSRQHIKEVGEAVAKQKKAIQDKKKRNKF